MFHIKKNCAYKTATDNQAIKNMAANEMKKDDKNRERIGAVNIISLA